MPSQETDHVSPTEVTPELGKEALGTWRPPRPSGDWAPTIKMRTHSHQNCRAIGDRLDKTGAYAMTVQGARL